MSIFEELYRKYVGVQELHLQACIYIKTLILKMNQITIDQGTLIGGHATTSNGFNYIEFLEIPYAQPPLGDLRFKSPQPLEPWKGIRNATVFNPSHICIHPTLLDNVIIGSEDCLYLNVFTPRTVDLLKLLPVMFYLHGGGYNLGTGIFKQVGGPDYLIEHDVVIVSINYRLNVFGFLSLDIPEAAGNMGLKDQVMALKWVQDNIGRFGGDKNRVTIYGHSSGSSSIEFHILSPLTRNLFHKAILQSGSILNHWAIRENVKDVSIELALDMGYQGPSSDIQKLLKFLMEQPAELIQKSYIKIASYFKVRGTNCAFSPIIEKDLGNGEAFFTDNPYSLMKKGQVPKIEIIYGFEECEGILAAALKPQDIVEINENRRFVDFWTFEMSSKDKEIYNAKLNEVYKDTEKDVIDFFSDFDFIGGIIESAEQMSRSGFPVYVYMFKYDGNINYFKGLYDIPNKGACHIDDFSYLHKVNFPSEMTPIEDDVAVMKRMTKMWTDFVKFGNPTPNTSELIPVQWPRFNSDTKQYLVIDRELEVRSDYQPEKMAVFHEIYEKYGK